MNTIAISGVTGMIGSMVYNVLKEDCRVVVVYRNEERLELLEKVYGGLGRHRMFRFDFMDLYHDYREGFPTTAIGRSAQRLIDAVGDVDAFINCAGITKSYATRDPLATFFLNGILPDCLSRLYGDKLIHITTDCVYSGIQGAPYTEISIKTPNDLYGLSKSVGEPSERSLVLRTSTIGPELVESVSLISWLRSQEGKTVQGYVNHLWNGITTREFGNICLDIIRDRFSFPRTGLFHVFSTDISKHDMLCAFKKKYRLSVTIEPVETMPPVDRRLRSIHDLVQILEISPFDQMLEAL